MSNDSNDERVQRYMRGVDVPTASSFIRASPAFEESLRKFVRSMEDWATANEGLLSRFATVPYAPQRVPGQTARQYRASRRRYSRECRAWRREWRAPN